MKNIYCISDIHNDLESFHKMLKLIEFSVEDEMYILGDFFDRGPNPFGIYREILRNDNMFPIMGNHELCLAKSILDDSKISDSHAALAEVLTELDLIELKDWISSLPLQRAVVVGGRIYVMAHAQTTKEPEKKHPFFFLVGMDHTHQFLEEEVNSSFLQNGIEGCISIIGHYPTNVIRRGLEESSVYPNSIWSNEKQNVFCIDCGNGYRFNYHPEARLGCLRLNDHKCFYV